MYKFEVDAEIQKQVDNLEIEWQNLIYNSKKKDFDMNEYKKSFAVVTQKDVATFKEELKEVYEEYKTNGPGCEHVTLEEGVESLQHSK